MLVPGASMSRFAFTGLAIALLGLGYLAVLYLAQRSLLLPAPLEQPPPLGRAELVRLPAGGARIAALKPAPRRALSIGDWAIERLLSDWRFCDFVNRSGDG
jgi:hypothetical protein